MTASATSRRRPDDARSVHQVSGHLQPGEKAPFFCGMRADGGFHSSEDQFGRPTALILGGRRSPAALLPWLQAFIARAGSDAAHGCDALLLVSADPRWMSAPLPEPGPILLHCSNEALFTHTGDGDERPTVLLLDRTLRIVACLARAVAGDAALALGAWLSAWSREQPATVGAPAPVLIVPNLLDTASCKALIDHFEASAHVDGAMASLDLTGRPVNRIDAEKKHRRDCTLDTDSPLHRLMLKVLERRLLPEIARVFHSRATHVDRLLIARYDDSGGYFRPHRDNSAPQTAFRQFALSLNLNTEAYEGGDLRFPEFNDHPHRPPTGAACVFSASLLHEACRVTRGRRYVLLTFLHDDAAEAARQADRANSDDS